MPMSPCKRGLNQATESQFGWDTLGLTWGKIATLYLASIHNLGTSSHCVSDQAPPFMLRFLGFSFSTKHHQTTWLHIFKLPFIGTFPSLAVHHRQRRDIFVDGVCRII